MSLLKLFLMVIAGMLIIGYLTHRYDERKSNGDLVEKNKWNRRQK